MDPSLRRRGYCAAVVGAVLMMLCLEHVELFAAGVRSACAGLTDCLRMVCRVPNFGLFV